MLPSTQRLPAAQRLRATLVDRSFWHGAASLAIRLYERLASTRIAFPISRPTTPQQGVWVQDLQVSSQTGNVTVGDVTRALSTAAGDVGVLDLALLTPGQSADPVEREAVAAAGAKQYAAETVTFVDRLLGTLRTVRAVAVVGIALGLVVYFWPWIRALWAARKVATHG